MIAQQTDYMQYKNFVAPKRDITIFNASLSAAQRDEVKRRLISRWPSVAGCQATNANRRFRLLPVRGATIPDDLTDEHVLSVVEAVQNPEVDADMAILQPDKVQ